MKAPILVPIFVALAGTLSSAAEFSVFRVCQDQRVIHTSDGAEAGRVEYIVVDPADQHVVSTVISGGVVGERLIAVPYNSLRFSGNNQITLTEITRERLVSAPVIERTQISASVIEPSVIQRTTTHFSARGDVRGDVRGDRTTVEGGAAVTGRTNDPRSNAEATRSGEARSGAEAAGSRDPRANADAASRRDAEARTQAEADRSRTESNANRPPGTPTNEADPAAAAKQRGETNADPNAATKPDAQHNKHNAKGEADAAKNKADAARPGNAEENRSATKPNHDANNNSPKADATREHNENARPQDEAQPGRERKGAADRNASEETAKGRKAGEENATDSKRPPKKGQEPAGEEKARNEQRSPQL